MWPRCSLWVVELWSLRLGIEVFFLVAEACPSLEPAAPCFLSLFWLRQFAGNLAVFRPFPLLIRRRFEHSSGLLGATRCFPKMQDLR